MVVDDRRLRIRAAYALLGFSEDKLAPKDLASALEASLVPGTRVERYGRGWFMAQYSESDDRRWIMGRLAFPYRLIAFTSSLTILLGALGLFFWPELPASAKATILGASAGLAVWAVWRAFDLVRITAGHGRLKMRLPEVPEAYREAVKRQAS